MPAGRDLSVEGKDLILPSSTSSITWGDVSTATVVHLTEVPVTDEAAKGQIVVGSLAAFCPFTPKRFYMIHGMDRGEKRGHHAHKALWQAIIAMFGSVEIVLDSGTDKRAFTLEHPAQCLIVPPGLWRDITSLEEGSLLFVLASDDYDETDYIRDYASFIAFRSGSVEGGGGTKDGQ